MSNDFATSRFSPAGAPASSLSVSKATRLLVVLYFFTLTPARAQSPIEYSVHANIIYHFTKYVDWPDDKKTGDFVIGVVGDTPLSHELKKVVTNKTCGSQPIVIKKISPSQQSFDCHILVLPEDEAGSLKKIQARTAGSPVLLVCEEEGAASKGAAISFKIVSDRLKLEINKNNIEKHHLNVASDLLRLGILVK